MQEDIKNKWGRPCEYKEEYIGKVDEYLSQCVDGHKEVFKTRQMTDEDGKIKEVITNESVKKVSLPTIEWFALFIGVAKSSLYEWVNDNDKFSNALDKIMIEQKRRLLEEGLSGNYNPTIAKLVLSANHGMKETTVQENTWKDWWPIQLEDVSALTLKQLDEERKKLLW